MFCIWLDFYSFIHLTNIIYHPCVPDTGEWHMKKTDEVLAVMEAFIPYWILCEMFWHLQTVIGSISRLGSDLSKEWENVKCSYLRRVRWGYVRQNKEWVDCNGTKAVSATSTEYRKKFNTCQVWPSLMGQETWMSGTLGLIQLMGLQFYPLCVSQLFWLLLYKIIYYMEESKTYNSWALF